MTRTALMIALSLSLAACGGTTTPGPGTPPPPAKQAPAAGLSANAQINAIRASAGRSAVTRNAKLDAAARGHAQDMITNNFFGHTGSKGSTAGKRATRAGFKWCAVNENINKGYPGRTAAIEGWRTSPGHYRNMVAANVTQYGLANVGDVWVMVMAKGC